MELPVQATTTEQGRRNRNQHAPRGEKLHQLLTPLGHPLLQIHCRDRTLPTFYQIDLA